MAIDRSRNANVAPVVFEKVLVLLVTTESETLSFQSSGDPFERFGDCAYGFRLSLLPRRNVRQLPASHGFDHAISRCAYVLTEYEDRWIALAMLRSETEGAA
jgi:hypothetical protein